ncbi:hypothetical protein QYE76_052665 [Lolium multiflorum]|uniref:CCHC-type domain-containing protein n=1 Tax=Lolium multiflorum TaxID=4521 RepID=A0AAD8SVT4_LOLMU|nr:hypothetical protein QYE76_052665 [Lolium multiflorum]
MDVKLDMELDMKKSHGRARRSGRHAREKKKSRPVQPVRPAAPGCRFQPVGPPRAPAPLTLIIRLLTRRTRILDIIGGEFEALRNEMRREFRAQDDELMGTLDEIKQTLDATNVTVTGLSDQMTDIQRNLADMRLAIENLTVQQQQQQEDDEDPELEDDAHNGRGAPRGHRPRGWVPLGRNGRGQDEEDGLGVKTVDEYYMEMEMLMQRGRVRESLEMTMQRFLNGLNWLKKQRLRDVLRELAFYTPRALYARRLRRSAPYSTPPSKPASNVSNAKKSESAASTSGSGASTTRNRDMLCHTCGGKGHFKRDCPNRKVMFINEDNEYETGDDADPNAPDNDDYDTDGEDAYPSDARTIVVSQRALNVLPSASTQRCNLFQTKALVGPDKACKVIIDGGSYRNLASKELCTKLKLKYLPHPHPYYIQWLSDNGEMKESHAGGLMGHFGREKTLLMLADHFYWPKMRRDVDRYVRRCITCNKSKSKLKPHGIKRRASHEEERSSGREDGREVDMELDMKKSHGRAREEREACARGEEEVQPVQNRPTGRHAAAGSRPAGRRAPAAL